MLLNNLVTRVYYGHLSCRPFQSKQMNLSVCFVKYPVYYFKYVFWIVEWQKAIEQLHSTL